MGFEDFLKLSKISAFLLAISNLETEIYSQVNCPQNLVCQTVAEGKEH